MKRIGTLFGLLFFILVAAHGQTDTSGVYRILTKDGNQYIGKVISEANDTLTLETEALGRIRIPVVSIKSRLHVKPTITSEGALKYWPENHHATRYFFGPNGYGLDKGEGYYQNNWVFFNQVSYGITENFTMGIGMIPLFLFAESVTPVWITPKFSFEITEDKFAVAAGGLFGTVFGEDASGFGGVAYGSGTVGSRDRNFSVGLGYGYSSEGGWADSPTISFSGLIRLSEKFYLLTENYWFGIEGSGLVSLGGRTSWPNIALDYGLIVPIFDGYVEVAIPWLGICLPFGH